MGTKRKFEEIGRTSQGCGGDASSLLGGDDQSCEKTSTGSPQEGDSPSDTSLQSGGDRSCLGPPQAAADQRLVLVPSGREVVTLHGGYEDGRPFLFAAGASTTVADILENPDPEAGDVLVIVPPMGHISVERVISFEELARGLRQALFGPTTPMDGSCSLWTDTNQPWIPPTQYFLAGHEASAVAPPVSYVVLHVRSRYNLYLLWHRAGFANRAHTPIGGLTPRTTLDVFDRNRELIRSAIHRLLTPAQHRHSLPLCRRCGETADWVASCCSMILCSYCLPREFVFNHLPGSPCQANEKGTPLDLLERSREIIPGTSRVENGWICTRQLVVLVEEERHDRTCQKDVFVFRTFTQMEFLESMLPARRKTVFYHMMQDGNLREVITIGGTELPFLW